MNMLNYGYNPMTQYGAFNPYGMQYGYPQLGGLFGGYNMGFPGRRDMSQQAMGFSPAGGLFDLFSSFLQQQQGGAAQGTQGYEEAEPVRAQPRTRPSSGVAPGLFETETPAPRQKPSYDRTFVSGGVGKNAGPTKQVFPGSPNFGARYERTGEFGKKGLKTIRGLGYTGDASAIQSQFLEDNPVIAKRYSPSSSPVKAKNPGRRNAPRTR